MNPILEEFCDKWVWPTMPGAPGAEFRWRLTKEKCLKGWEIALHRTLDEIQQEMAAGNNEVRAKERALRGYSAEGVQMSIKQMSAQLLSVSVPDQERYIELQRMRARQARPGSAAEEHGAPGRNRTPDPRIRSSRAVRNVLPVLPDA